MEIVNLLSDVEKIRGERRKAKANRAKYVGVGNDQLSGVSFNMSGSRYGGFGSESLNNYSNQAAASYSGSRGFSDADNNKEEYEEYDAGDDDDRAEDYHVNTPGSSTTPVSKPQKKEPEVDLFDFGEDEAPVPAPTQAPSAPAPTSSKPAPATQQTTSECK